MIVTHSQRTYECAVAVKCANDKYIKLYDENGNEIAAFYNISDFSDYTISGGSFIAPCDCMLPIALTTYVIGGRTIAASEWILSEDRAGYYCEIESSVISGNESTCDCLLIFEPGTEFKYDARQTDGKLVLYTDAAPLYDVVIKSIQVTRI